MLIQKSVKEFRYIKTKIELIVASCPICKQTNEQTDNKLNNKQKYVFPAPPRCKKKRLMKISAASAKKLQTLKRLPKIFIKMAIRINIYCPVPAFFLKID